MMQHSTVELTSMTGATVSSTAFFSAGSITLAVLTYITTAFGTTNGTTGYHVGDGIDADLFGVAAAVTAGTETNNGDWTAAPITNRLSAANLIITAVGGNFDGTGDLRIEQWSIRTNSLTS